MKKAFAISLVIISAVMFLCCGWAFSSYMASTDTARSRIEGLGLDPDTIYREGFEQHIKKGRVVTGAAALAGIGIFVAGYRLSRQK